MFRFTGENTIFILIFYSICVNFSQITEYNFHKRPNEIATNDRKTLEIFA